MNFHEALQRLEKDAANALADLKSAQTEPQRKYALMMSNRADLAIHMLRSGHGVDAAFKALRFGV